MQAWFQPLLPLCDSTHPSAHGRLTLPHAPQVQR